MSEIAFENLEANLRTLFSRVFLANHPNIFAIQNNCKNRIKFAFEEMDLASIEQ